MESNVLQLIERPHEDEHFLNVFLRGRPVTTAKVYRNEVELFREFLNKPLGSAPADDLRSYIERCRESKLKPATLRHKVCVIKSLYSFLCDDGQMNSDPMRRVSTPPHVPADQSRCLSSKQVKTFFSAIPLHRVIGFRDRAIYILAANCGLRLSELSRLSCGDVGEGPEAGWMLVNVHGKGDKLRTVQVRPEVWIHVQEYLKRRNGDLNAATPLFASFKRDKPIRPQANDLRMPAATIYKRFKWYARAAGLPDWASPHCLRHYFASEAHEKGAPAEAIRRALGHASLAVTQRYLDRLDQGINAAFRAVKAV